MNVGGGALGDHVYFIFLQAVINRVHKAGPDSGCNKNVSPNRISPVHIIRVEINTAATTARATR